MRGNAPNDYRCCDLRILRYSQQMARTKWVFSTFPRNVDKFGETGDNRVALQNLQITRPHCIHVSIYTQNAIFVTLLLICELLLVNKFLTNGSKSRV